MTIHQRVQSSKGLTLSHHDVESPSRRSFWPWNTSGVSIVVLTLLAGGCVNVSVVNHDETRALERGRAVLVALHMRRDFSQALNQFGPKARETVSEASLRRLVSSVTREFGPVVSLQYDRWFPVLGRRSATVVFVAIHKGGRSYHRVELQGDASDYMVESISYSSQPVKP